MSYSVSYTLDRDVSQNEVVSTASETTVYSYSVPGGTLGTNRALRITVIGDYLNAVSTQTFTFKVKYGSTTIFSAANSTSSSANRGAIIFRGTLAAAGATGAQVAEGIYDIAEGSDNNVAGVSAGTSSTNRFMTAIHNAIAEDSTAAKTLAITAQHNASNANLSFRCHTVHVEVIQ